MNLMLLEPDEVSAQGLARLSGARARHAFTVLRVRPGQAIRIGLINGPLGTGRVRHASAGTLELECVFSAVAAPVEPDLNLLLALPRPKVLRRLIPQITALGVRRILLTNAWRVEKCYFDSSVLTPEALRAGILEGLAQSGATRLPTVEIFPCLRPLLEGGGLPAGGPGALRLVAHPGADAPLRAVWPAARAPTAVLLAIGPEGGWLPAELDLLARRDFRAFTAGARILRADTACLALLGAVQILWAPLAAPAR